MGVASRRRMSQTRPREPSQEQQRCHVVLVGDARVGKTALVNRVVYDKFSESPSRKVSAKAARSEYVFAVAGRTVKYSITDLSGYIPTGGNCSSMHRSTFLSAEVFLLCYKISDPSTLFSALNTWCSEIRAIAPRTPIILVGCQSDLRHDRDILSSLSRTGLAPVSADQALSVSQQSGCQLYVETSAKTCSRSALSAFEVAGLVVLGQLESSSSPPKVPPKVSKLSPPVPPKPRRALSQLALHRTPPMQQQQQMASSPKLSLKTSKERSSASLISLTSGNAVGASSFWMTPRLQRRHQRQHQQQQEKMVTIKCQRLTPDKRYEEVEVEVPEPIYETLRFYNESNKARMVTRGGGGGDGAAQQGADLVVKSKKSLAAKIRSIFAQK